MKGENEIGHAFLKKEEFVRRPDFKFSLGGITFFHVTPKDSIPVGYKLK